MTLTQRNIIRINQIEEVLQESPTAMQHFHQLLLENCTPGYPVSLVLPLDVQI